MLNRFYLQCQVAAHRQKIETDTQNLLVSIFTYPQLFAWLQSCLHTDSNTQGSCGAEDEHASITSRFVNPQLNTPLLERHIIDENSEIICIKSPHLPSTLICLLLFFIYQLRSSGYWPNLYHITLSIPRPSSTMLHLDFLLSCR